MARGSSGICCYVSFSLLFVIAGLLQADETRSSFGGGQEVHDQEHLNQHLRDKIDVNGMTPEQQKFHYFSLHDLNKDQRVDGLEILKALSHDHEHGSGGPGIPITDEEQMVKMIDMVLSHSDFNHDGFIDYGEYLKKQEDEEKSKESKPA